MDSSPLAVASGKTNTILPVELYTYMRNIAIIKINDNNITIITVNHRI